MVCYSINYIALNLNKIIPNNYLRDGTYTYYIRNSVKSTDNYWPF